MVVEAGLYHTCTLQKRYRKQKLAVSSVSGTFTVGGTLTGGSSHNTATIDRVSSTYLVLSTLSGAFTVGETVSSGAATATAGATTDYQNQSGEYDYYWKDETSSLPCKFYVGSGKVVIQDVGEAIVQPLKIRLPGWITLQDKEYRITTTTTGFSGTYHLNKVYTRSGACGTISHYECDLNKIVTST